MVAAILQRHVEQHAWRAEQSAGRSSGHISYMPQMSVARELSLCFEEAAGDAIDAQPPPMLHSLHQPRRNSVPTYF